MKKMAISLLCLCTFISSFIVTLKQNQISAEVVSLTESYNLDLQAFEYSNGDIVYMKSEEELSDRSAAAIAIFVGGILFGYVIDGVIIFTTGHSGDEWVARALQYIKDHPGAKSVNIAADCSVYPTHSEMGCH